MRNLELFKSLFESFYEAIYIVDVDRKILYFNPIAEELSGFSSYDVTHSLICGKDKNSKDNAIDSENNIIRRINSNKIFDSFVIIKHKNGYHVPLQVRIIPLIEENEIVGSIEVFVNEPQIETAYDLMILKRNLLYIDSLTGLYNRHFIEHKFLHIFQDKKDTKYAILFIDIDNFKSANDKYGHLFGDKVIKMIASTIVLNTRLDDFAIRFGGDEIVVIVQADSIIEAKMTAEKIRVLINNSRIIENEIDYIPSVSIGVTTIHENESFYDAIKRADEAMYKSKKAGKNRTYLADKIE